MVIVDARKVVWDSGDFCPMTYHPACLFVRPLCCDNRSIPSLIARSIAGLLCLLAILRQDAVADHPVARAAEATAVYQGEITRERNRDIFQKAASRPLMRLRITSPGGSVEAGIELGLWVKDLGLDVEIEGHCLSSCANYVFPAARHKTIRDGAVVAWHGNYLHLWETGQWVDDVAPRMARYGEDEITARRRAREEAQRLARLERGFFAGIGVDEAICRIGKLPPFSVPDYYFLSVADMARFGVDNVDAPRAYAATDTDRFDVDIVLIDLGAE